LRLCFIGLRLPWRDLRKHMQEVEDHELYISSYACVQGNSETSRTGGVLLYIKEEIKYEQVEQVEYYCI